MSPPSSARRRTRSSFSSPRPSSADGRRGRPVTEEDRRRISWDAVLRALDEEVHDPYRLADGVWVPSETEHGDDDDRMDGSKIGVFVDDDVVVSDGSTLEGLYVSRPLCCYPSFGERFCRRSPYPLCPFLKYDGGFGESHFSDTSATPRKRKRRGSGRSSRSSSSFEGGEDRRNMSLKYFGRVEGEEKGDQLRLVCTRSVRACDYNPVSGRTVASSLNQL
mmetsp:Transcript_5193/g.10521  ORF Transcript_5193/g.10521 Transcript_5193/m.10521 type:complete len:220 (-) Transcript_5193:333-992(-)